MSFTVNVQKRFRVTVSKTKVAPIKTVLLSRLELCAALFLAKLLHSVKKILRLPNVHIWSDYFVASDWICGSAFVANRVSEIQDLVNPSC